LSILTEAQELIHGDRQKDYGHPRDNITHTANMFSAYLNTEVTPLDVCNLMMMLKMSRVHTTGYHRDSIVDIAGYAGVAERVYEEPVDLDGPGYIFNVQNIDAAIALKDTQRSKPLGTPDDHVFFVEHMTQPVKPRVWESLTLVPVDLPVVDADGDSWVGEGPEGSTDYDKYGPFTEIIEESA
jgi:hypothetical protein